MTQSRRERVTTAINTLSVQVSDRVQQLPVPDRPRNWLARHPRLTTLVLLVAAVWLAGKLLGIFVSVVQWTIGLAIVVGLPIGYFWIWLKLFQHLKQQGISTDQMIGLSVVVFIFAFYIPFAPHLILLVAGKPKKKTRKRQGRRGTELIKAAELRELLRERQAALTFVPKLPLFEIAGIEIPSDLENLGFFFVGSPGSGKTQAIKRLLAILRERPDFRVMVLDRNGELLESFYQEGGDLLFNPKDARSVNWNHGDEGMEPETIAAALVPDD